MAITLNRNKFKYKNPSGSGYRNVDLLEEESKVNDVQVDGTSVVTSGVANIDLSGKADKTDTVLDTTLSRGRKEDSIVGNSSFAFGTDVIASGSDSHAEGNTTYADGSNSHAEGSGTYAGGMSAHAEGFGTYVSGNYSHVEGKQTRSLGDNSHAEGFSTVAFGGSSHAEGFQSITYGSYSHSEGSGGITNMFITGDENVVTYTVNQLPNQTTIDELVGVPVRFGNSYAKIVSVDAANNTVTFNKTLGAARTNSAVATYRSFTSEQYTHVEGYSTKAVTRYQHVQGRYNKIDADHLYADIVGNGTNEATKSNAFALTWTGDGKYAGDVYVGANADSSGGSKLARESIIAPAEAATATSAHAIGDKFILDGQLCKATAAIAVGDAIATTGISANAEVTQIVDELGSGGAVDDVKINGTSILQNGVANIPVASDGTLGVVRFQPAYGVSINDSNYAITSMANGTFMKAGSDRYHPVVPLGQHAAVFYGLAKLAGTDMKDIANTTLGVYPEAQKSAINSMLNAPETVSGTTPVIVANAGIQYVCGEVSTIDITPCATGVCDVVFRSGSTPAVLTMPNTVMFPSWFDSTALEADTYYEINVLNGTMGTVALWA